MKPETIRQGIPCLQNAIYLNSGSLGPTLRVVVEAEQAVLAEQLRTGGAAPSLYQHFGEINQSCRVAVAQAIGATADEIALTQSTSDGIGAVAAGIAWQAGDEVITSDLEHISGLLPWRVVADRYGVQIVNLQGHDGYLSVDDFATAITERTRLICISHVAWNSGALLPVAEVCALAQERGIMVVVDGAQSAGQLQIDVRKLGCHFYSLPGHKWMMGPLGTGALYVRQDMISQLNTSRVGWASAAHDEENNFTLHASARRYEAGTIHSPAYAGWQAALEYVASIGSEQVFARILHLAQVARDIFHQVPGCEVLGPTNSAYWSGLLALRFADRDPKMLAEQLWQEKRIITRWIPQPYAFRLSLHAFVTEQELEQVAGAISKSQ